MKQASVEILSEENKKLLNGLLIDYYTMNNSKVDELAYLAGSSSVQSA